MGGQLCHRRIPEQTDGNLSSGQGQARLFAILSESIVIELLDLLLKGCGLDDDRIPAESFEVFFQLKLRPIKVVQVSFDL